MHFSNYGLQSLTFCIQFNERLEKFYLPCNLQSTTAG